MHNVIRNCIFPPDELVEQVVEPWDETKLSQHLVNLRGVTGGKKQFNSVQTKNSSSALMVGKST